MMQDALSKTFAALADPTRRAILAQVARDGAVNVGDIVLTHKLSQPAISKHLKVLEEAKLIQKSRVAKTRPCSLNPEGLIVARRWIDTYKQYWTDTFEKMDVLIASMEKKEHPHDH
jgi:DNA-binding transcriptional ArsR family regulator